MFYRTHKHTQVLKPLFTDLYGIKERPVRWKKCYHSTNSIMAGHVSKLYVERFFPDENRQVFFGFFFSLPVKPSSVSRS